MSFRDEHNLSCINTEENSNKEERVMKSLYSLSNEDSVSFRLSGQGHRGGLENHVVTRAVFLKECLFSSTRFAGAFIFTSLLELAASS